MSNNVKVKLPELSLSSQDMEKIGEEIINLIKIRTEEGLDKDGKPFEPYSASYSRKKKQTNVDLKVSGKLLNSMEAEATSDSSVKIFIKGVPYSKKVVDKRPILGLTEKEKEKVRVMIKERILK